MKKNSWLPGHMAQARRGLWAQIKLVDLVVELLDARIPQSSASPALRQKIGNKRHLVVLNKADLAAPEGNRAWQADYARQGLTAICLDARATNKELERFLAQAQAEVLAAASKKGRQQRPLRLIVVGIPNVGKSTLINRLVGRRATATGNRPGVTRGQQWVRIPGGYELLDTPGVLWPAETAQVHQHLAATGTIPPTEFDLETVALNLAGWLLAEAPQRLQERYDLPDAALQKSEAILTAIGQARGFMLSGGRVDLPRAAQTLLGDFRRGLLGRLTLEWPESATEVSKEPLQT